MKMKKILAPLAVLLLALILDSCASSKNVPYFKNSEFYDGSQSAYLYDARIMPKDELTITVSTIIPQAAVPYNLLSPTTSGSTERLQTYLVDNMGYIMFPVVGKLKVAGLTKSEAEELILSKIKPFMNAGENPIVTVRQSGYAITVLGEVGGPGTFKVSREKINILEALAQAGDLTIYGKRDRVFLIREDATGKKEFHKLNLNDANILDSPYYYLQQNDIIYVEPNKVKARNSNLGQSVTIWFSVLSTLMSVTTFTIQLVK
jgi:polysaccharide export outer membrane protein